MAANTAGMNPHDTMRINMIKGRLGGKRNQKMGVPGGMGHLGRGSHHRHHGPPGMGGPMGGGIGAPGAGGPGPGEGGGMGTSGPTFPTQGGF